MTRLSGLKGDNFGTLRAGYISDVMNDASEQKLLVDPWEWGYNAKTARGLANITRVDKRLQGVRYDSPKIWWIQIQFTTNWLIKPLSRILKLRLPSLQSSIVSWLCPFWFEVHGVYGLYKQQNIDQDNW